MKINKKKVMVSALAVAMGAALVGSISGTIAWYQYSTRVTTAMVGTSAGVSRNLQIKIKGWDGNKEDGQPFKTNFTNDWRSEIATDEITQYLKAARKAGMEGTSKTAKEFSDNEHLRPITSGEKLKTDDVTAFYGNPVYQERNESKWIKAEKQDYVEVTFQIRAIKGDGTKADAESLVVQDVYLTDLTIAEKAVENKKSMVNAVRVHLKDNASAAHSYLFSQLGEAISTSEKLDVNNDGYFDTVYQKKNGANFEDVTYDFQIGEGGRTEEIIYGANTTGEGNANGKQAAFKEADKVVTSTNGVLTLPIGATEANLSDRALFKTTTDANSPLEVTMKIWLEGWQPLDALTGNETKSQTTASGRIWDTKDYVGSMFNVGISLAVNADERA